MANVNLNTYGPHTIGASNDYYLNCVGGNESKRKQLTIGMTVRAGNITIMTRKRGSAMPLEVQSYSKPDETLSAVAIAASTSVRVDCTGKDVVLRTAAATDADVDMIVDTDT